MPWINPSLEYLDEFKDAEILKAVVDSMNDWQRKHDQKTNTRFQHYKIMQYCKHFPLIN